jgi:hypothetical protein
MHDQRVKTVDLDGRCEEVVRVENDPSGLGWLPDGRLLVVSMRDRRLLRLDSDGLHEVADSRASPPSLQRHGDRRARPLVRRQLRLRLREAGEAAHRGDRAA